MYSKQRAVDSEDDEHEFNDSSSSNKLPRSSITDSLDSSGEVKYKKKFNRKQREEDFKDMSKIDNFSGNAFLPTISDFSRPGNSHHKENPDSIVKYTGKLEKNEEKPRFKFDEQEYEKYICDICERAFHKRSAIICHLRKSICFPD